jgi:hypothetical protein
VQQNAVAALDQTAGKIADHRLRAAGLGRAQRADGRGDDRDPHVMGIT